MSANFILIFPLITLQMQILQDKILNELNIFFHSSKLIGRNYFNFRNFNLLKQQYRLYLGLYRIMQIYQFEEYPVVLLLRLFL